MGGGPNLRKAKSDHFPYFPLPKILSLNLLITLYTANLTIISTDHLLEKTLMLKNNVFGIIN